MKKCPDMHHSTFSSDNYCWKCGKKLIDIAEQRCTCGETFGEVDEYCKNCGNKRPQESVKK